ncbi:MAG: divergent polysaccharide deacetylase family protein [Pseudohongiellaceae bacterium]|nr:divergent polysaccharide deacetylase family protein [Pseudohongiellaceae bacterium]
MKPEETGPLPFKSDRKHPDPFIDAILRNPQPLIMVSIGVVGMLIFAIAMSVTGNSDAEPQQQETHEAQEAIVFKVDREQSNVQSVSDTPQNSVPEDTAATAEIAPSTDGEIEATSETSAQSLNPDMLDPNKHYISIIIDDIGNNGALGRRAVNLPGEVTYAVLPHTPFGAQLAEAAHLAHKEIMLHAPMSNQAQLPLGPGALTAELSKEAFIEVLNNAIDAIPYLQGINNHMGSALTEQELPMQWVMEVLNERKLYFVDSRTTAASVAANVAKAHEIPNITRNVFLDNETTHESIDKEFKRMVKQAQEYGSSVGIGHPYKETLEYLEVAIPELEQQGVELIFASKMIQLRADKTSAKANKLTQSSSAKGAIAAQ